MHEMATDVYGSFYGDIDLSQRHKNLLASVLTRAILDALGCDRKGMGNSMGIKNIYHTRAEAKKWLLTKEEEEKTPFSCEWICEALNIPAHVLRKIIIQADSVSTEETSTRLYKLLTKARHMGKS